MSPDQRVSCYLSALLHAHDPSRLHPPSPKGAPSWGVSREALSSHLGRPLRAEDHEALDRAGAEAVIRSVYLADLRHGETPPGLDHALLGAAMLMGRQRAIAILESVAGLAPDGCLSPEDLKHLSAAIPDASGSTQDVLDAHERAVELITKLHSALVEHLGRLPDVSEHGRVRLDRLHQVTEYAILHAWTARTEAHAITELAARCQERAGDLGVAFIGRDPKRGEVTYSEAGCCVVVPDAVFLGTGATTGG